MPVNSQPEKSQKVIRQFGLTNLALKNKNSIYLLILILFGFGFYSYTSMPKELFPDIVIPTVLVQTAYPGNPPLDMENLVTRPIEKELEVITGVKEIASTSSQDISSIVVEFNTGVDLKQAVLDVKDAVDKAKSELPDDLPADPLVQDIDFSEFPIIYINLSGDYSLNELKKYAEYLEDEIETYSEISKVDIKGLNEREFSINVDPFKMEMLEISFGDIESAVGYENISMAAGQFREGDYRRSIRILGEFETAAQMGDIIVKSEKGNIVYLKDIALVTDGFAEPKDFSRLNRQPVVTLHVIKKGGENLLSATDKIFDLLDRSKEDGNLPEGLNITITNDQSDLIRKQLDNLENSMIMGVILVVFVLFLFLGARNAFFVGFAIPLSMFISFLILNLMGYKLNMILLFSLILALGMLVDNAIVVMENIYRYFDRGYSRMEASRLATGEIAIAIISSTATTLAAFFPLLFWDSMIGEFMKLLPLTLIIVLTASLFVALTVTPVLTSSFLKPGDQLPKPKIKRSLIIVAILLLLAGIFYAGGMNTPGSLLVLFAIIGIANLLFLNRMARWFMNVFLPWLESAYLNTMNFVMKARRPYWVIAATFFLLIFTIVLMGIRQPKVIFFPSPDPSYINIMATLPVGTDITATNKFMGTFEEDVYSILTPYSRIVKSVLTTVGNGAKSENEGFDISETPHRGMVTVTFVDFEFREGVNTNDILKAFSDNLIGKYPGVMVAVDKPSSGPPVGKAINIEVTGEDFDKLVMLVDDLLNKIDNAGIDGIEGLKTDLNLDKPEAIVHIDRDRARRYGLSTAQIAGTIRTALFGKEISDFKEGEEEYPIQLRLKEEFRYNVASLMNQKITFRDQASGKIQQVPITAVADISYGSTYEAIKRKDLDRVITLSSNVLKGFNATDINNQLKEFLSGETLPSGYTYKFTGEQQEQDESMAFLGSAMLIALALILLIMVSQFNSVVKPVIIMISVLFSTIGVFGGLATFRMDFVVIMTGIGLVSLAGIVVNNAIVLIDYTDLLKLRKRTELGMEENALLPKDIALDCVIQAGRTRLRPVLLTAVTTLLGLIPLASGLNIDFLSLFEHFDPKIYFGGDNVAFWGPISWTIIFGLTFSTFLTLIVVPAMYHVLYLGKIRIHEMRKRK
ncbi:MAG: efflux RND transporter permease subunit [Bacteroidales bacterium]|jgi:multidrug efflux pump subunit AcrB|nr:efflux RND transporter permease subunit [Bacteroidales bacterium]